MRQPLPLARTPAPLPARSHSGATPRIARCGSTAQGRSPWATTSYICLSEHTSRALHQGAPPPIGAAMKCNNGWSKMRLRVSSSRRLDPRPPSSSQTIATYPWFDLTPLPTLATQRVLRSLIRTADRRLSPIMRHTHRSPRRTQRTSQSGRAKPKEAQSGRAKPHVHARPDTPTHLATQ